MDLKSKKDKLNRKASYASLFVATVLMIVKFFVGFFSGSMAIMASALDSALDFVASLINFMALKTSQEPADFDHRFGHEKAEALGSLFQSMLIFISGLAIIYKSFKSLVAKETITNLDEGLVIMVISLILTTALVLYQRSILKKTESLLVGSDSLHYLTDIATNLIVILSLLSAKFFPIPHLDPVIGIALSLYIIKGCFKIFANTVDILMDKDVSHLYTSWAQETVKRHYPNILGFHDLRTRKAGYTTFMDIHFEMPKEMSLKDSHDIIEVVMEDLKKTHPNVDIMIHADPAIEQNGEIKVFDQHPPKDWDKEKK